VFLFHPIFFMAFRVFFASADLFFLERFSFLGGVLSMPFVMSSYN